MRPWRSVQLAAPLVGRGQIRLHGHLLRTRIDSAIDATRNSRVLLAHRGQRHPRGIPARREHPAARRDRDIEPGQRRRGHPGRVPGRPDRRARRGRPGARPLRAGPRGTCVLAGGKRLRPTFAYWGWRGVVGPARPGRAGAAGPRRARADAHLRPGARRRDGRVRHPPRRAHRAPRSSPAEHVAAGRVGDPDRFGAAAAILVGDLCLVWADQLLARPPCRPRRCSRSRACYDRMRVEAIAGQYLDVLGETEPDAWSVERALRVARHKTASYTVQRPLQFGAALAGAGRAHDRAPRSTGAYSRYGAGGRRGLPAPRRPARRLRRPGGHRQARRRRPAHRQADHAAMLARQLATPAQRAELDQTRRSVTRRRLGGRTSPGSPSDRRHRRAGPGRGADPTAGRRGARRARARADRPRRPHGADRPGRRRHPPPGMMRPSTPWSADVRTVTGPTDRVVVVGAGLGGLACALHLAGGRPAGHRGRAGAGARRPGRPAHRRRVRVRHRPDRADHARADRRGARRGRRGAGRLARPDPARPGLPGATIPDGSTLDVITDTDRMAAEISRVCGPREADGYLRFVDYARGCGSWSGPTSSTATSTRPRDLLTANLLRLLARGRVPAAADRRSTSSSATRVPAGSSPSRRCTPAWRRTTRWPSTRSSPTSTRSPASTSRAAACTPCRGRWPARPRSTACRSGTAPR